MSTLQTSIWIGPS